MYQFIFHKKNYQNKKNCVLVKLLKTNDDLMRTKKLFDYSKKESFDIRIKNQLIKKKKFN